MVVAMWLPVGSLLCRSPRFGHYQEDQATTDLLVQADQRLDREHRGRNRIPQIPLGLRRLPELTLWLLVCGSTIGTRWLVSTVRLPKLSHLPQKGQL